MSDRLFIRFFDETGPAPIELLGGKCASLVALTTAGMPVPPGFAITTDAYTAFIESSGIADDIHALLGSIDPDDVESIDRVSAQIRDEILEAPGAARDPRRVLGRLRRAAGRGSRTRPRSPCGPPRRPKTCPTRASPGSRTRTSGSSAATRSPSTCVGAGPRSTRRGRSSTACGPASRTRACRWPSPCRRWSTRRPPGSR